MARPIPANPAGLQRRYDQAVVARPFVPGRPTPRPAPRAAPRAVPAGQEAFRWSQFLLLVSVFTGGLAVVSALEIWPPVAASLLGLDERAAFYLLVGGIYLLTTAFYAAWRTHLLRDLGRASWDVRLMAYGNLVVGGVVGLALSLLALVAAAILGLVVALIALLLRSAGDA